MKNLTLGILFFSTFIALQGQSRIAMGLTGGGNFSTFTSGIQRSGTISGNTYSGSLGPSGLFGYMGGGVFRYDQSDWAVEVDALYTNRSMKWVGQLNEEGGSNFVRNAMTITLNQIEVPLIGYYKMPVQTTVFKFGFGLFGSYGVGKIKVKDDLSNVPGSVVSTKTNYNWKEFGFNKFNGGGLIAFGSDFKMGETSLLGLELRAQSTFGNYVDSLNPNFGSGGEKVGIISLNLLVNFVF